MAIIIARNMSDARKKYDEMRKNKQFTRKPSTVKVSAEEQERFDKMFISAMVALYKKTEVKA